MLRGKSRNRRPVVSPTTRKRAEFVALALLGPLGGEIHYHRWPERSALGKTKRTGPRKGIG